MDFDTKITFVGGLLMFCPPLGLIAGLIWFVAHCKAERKYKEEMRKYASFN